MFDFSKLGDLANAARQAQDNMQKMCEFLALQIEQQKTIAQQNLAILQRLDRVETMLLSLVPNDQWLPDSGVAEEIARLDRKAPQ